MSEHDLVLRIFVIVCGMLFVGASWLVDRAWKLFQNAIKLENRAAQLAYQATICMGLVNDALALMNDGQQRAAEQKIAQAYAELRMTIQNERTD